MKQLSRLFIVVGCVTALLLAAMPAFAMFTESGVLPSSAPSARERQATPSVTRQAAASSAAAEQVAPQAPVATASVDSSTQAANAATTEPETAAPVERPKVIEVPPAAPNKEGEVEFTGTIASISGELPNLTLLVDDHTVKTDDQTLITGTLAVGQLVQVKGQVQLDGSILASRIKVEDVPGDEGEAEFRGPIVSLPGSLNFTGEWVVGDFTVTVDGSTAIDQSRGSIAVGAIAEVKAVRQPDGSLLAIQIKIEDANEFENEAEFKGIVSQLDGSAPAFTMLVNAIVVTTDAQTQISGVLADGATVEVHGSAQLDGSVLAKAINVEQPEAEALETEFTAHISGTLPADFLGVWMFDNGQSVTVDQQTLIDQSHGLLTPGALVQVKALKQLDGTWLAVRIKVEND